MLISSIGSAFNFNRSSGQGQVQKIQQEFEQLGQDLQAGNLTAAQSDFAALTGTQQGTLLAPPSNSPIAQTLNRLSQDLQTGNLSAAEQDYSALQQDFQSQATQGHRHHHHHGGEPVHSSGNNTLSQLFQELGQDLQSGNLTEAQQAYSALASDLQLGQSRAASPATTQTSGNSVSVAV